MTVFLLVLLFTNSNAQYMWQVKKDTVVKWYYYDGDEFNDSTLDEEKWFPSFSWSKVNYDMKFLMTKENLVHENGVYHFICKRDTGLYLVPNWTLDSSFIKKYKSDLVDGKKFKYLFTAGDVWSKMQYGHGYFEMRFKSTKSYGIYPGFFLFGTGKDEIDFFELKGERSEDIHVDIHCSKGCDRGYQGGNIFPKSFGGWLSSTNSLAETFNIISGEWQDGYVKWYLNGVGLAYFKGNLESAKMSLIFGTGPAQDGKPFKPGVNSKTVFPNSIDVDYVRVWYKDNRTKTDVLGKVNTSFDYAMGEESLKSFPKRKIRYMYNKNEFKKEFTTVTMLPKKNKSIIISFNGKPIEHNISFYDYSGKQLINKKSSDSFNEFSFSTLPDSSEIKVRIDVAGKELEELIKLTY